MQTTADPKTVTDLLKGFQKVGVFKHFIVYFLPSSSIDKISTYKNYFEVGRIRKYDRFVDYVK